MHASVFKIKHFSHLLLMMILEFLTCGCASGFELILYLIQRSFKARPKPERYKTARCQVVVPFP